MTDRELLEAAARAAGIEYTWCEFWKCMALPLPDGEAGWDYCHTWNPLTYEYDRYRLLQALKMGIDFDAQSVIYTLDGSICEESFRDDGDDARAVLRAAAEIGRARK